MGAIPALLTRAHNDGDEEEESNDDTNNVKCFQDHITNLLVYHNLLADELKELNSNNVDDVNNINDIVIDNLNKNLDRKITTKNQAILMNNREESTNTYLINILTSIFLGALFIYIFIILYYSAKQTSTKSN